MPTPSTQNPVNPKSQILNPINPINPKPFTMQDAYRAAGLVLRDRLLESLNDTNAYYRKMDVKRGYSALVFEFSLSYHDYGNLKQIP